MHTQLLAYDMNFSSNKTITDNRTGQLYPLPFNKFNKFINQQTVKLLQGSTVCLHCKSILILLISLMMEMIWGLDKALQENRTVAVKPCKYYPTAIEWMTFPGVSQRSYQNLDSIEPMSLCFNKQLSLRPYLASCQMCKFASKVILQTVRHLVEMQLGLRLHDSRRTSA